MVIFYVLELVLLAATAWFILTQVLWPAFRGKKLFPLFRKEQKLKDVLVEQEQEFVEQRLKKAIEDNEQLLHPVSSNDEASIVVSEKEKV